MDTDEIAICNGAGGPQPQKPLQGIVRTPALFAAFHCAGAAFLIFGHLDFVGILLIWLVMQFGINAGYHRCFAHHSFQTFRWLEFVLACMGCLAFQNGPLWWVSKHRHHHKFADTESDCHSPKKGFLHSHIAWLWNEDSDRSDAQMLADLRTPHLSWVENHQYLIHACYLIVIMSTFGFGGVFNFWILPIVLCWHTTFATNSIAHSIGTDPYKCTPSESCRARNNAIVALFNLGEGWHNNHHSDPSCCHHGFYKWYQLDITFIGIWTMAKFGLVWNVTRRVHLMSRAKHNS